MSSDNGIYILQSLDGYRVVHASAIENLYWHHDCCDNPKVVEEDLDPEDIYYHEICANCMTKDPEGEITDKLNPRMLVEYFGKCIIYDTEQEVLEEAGNIYEEIMDDDMGIIEYGISFIRGWEDKFFPDEDCGENN